ncbi:MAG: hypothetical protein ABIA67_04795 [Candidatus Margulisiibacteriota bacterium]
MNKSFMDEQNEIIAAYRNEPKTFHLSSHLGVGRYVKMADKIKRIIGQGKILDWGTGCGQMSFL